ncbi:MULTISPECIES: undecaprenyl-phosphate glucose phosphotransferase [Burkholderia]|uniref:Undecaprenyl-phosphate glucose phosphotransferase n=2 Tax=Burkholderia humptydooensis TaxID=430531 RepID=A0A7U4SVS7_9BURK|nr:MULTISPECIES: undecaprenyl-phosphate glucose phosphotransferase [Burkholderia]AGK50254.1 undecaprenyl-phosphate glucose phosphotransferase [Burkholderia thailandensis MSMB121]AJY40472.1 undecaprenyl-phosphate glucose phosphotransferase [Burkholderia sp. 2002721687]ALX46510.1 undecaprenyl-phosphate glucose phosphotransferase [Burkholderia humptydooensis]KST71461.1 undecaprenyl-phosphate glucose phosphotransferase [Burkholderia humptydooensis]KVN20075.1 undecaprenyl-phosphate glucose phosphot
MLSVLARMIDIAMAVAGAMIAAMIHRGGFVWLDELQRTVVVFDCMLVVVFFPAFGIYQSWRGKPVFGLMWRVSVAWLVVEGAGILMSFSVHHAGELSRLWLGYWAMAAITLLVASKACVYAVLRQLRRGGYNHKSVAIVGSAQAGATKRLVAHMRARPDAGFNPVCIYDEHGDASMAGADGIAIERRFADLVRRVRGREIGELWLVLPLSEEPQIHRIVTEFRNDFVNIRFVPDVRSLSFFNQEVIELLGVPAINLAASPITDVRILPKFVFDRLFALGALMMLSPAMLVIAMLVKLTSPGPVFFRQKRKGIDGNEFEIYKFRSMKMHQEAAGKVTQAKKNDSRVTPFGRFLRRTSLDELPQFINVLKGEMSVVGPRPHALEHDDIYKDLVKGYMFRYRIKPGITGWAQINGFRGETDRIEKMMGRVKLDLYYMQNWSFWLDIKIVALTLWKGFTGSNAY